MTGTSPISIRWRCRAPRCSASRPRAVEAIGRITPGCLGLYNDATEAALKPILASVRKRSKAAVDDAARPCRPQGVEPHAVGRRTVDPARRRRLAAGGTVGDSAQGGRDAAAGARRGGLGAGARRVRGGGQTRRAARHRRHRGALRARLSAASIPVADRQPAHRSIWRLAGEPHALSARSVRRGARGVSRTTSRSASGFPRPTGSRAAGIWRRPSNSRRN